MSRRLDVLLHDRVVGRLSELPDGGSAFRFSDDYLGTVSRPVLGQKFEDDLEKTYQSRKGQRLPDFFANLIPEGRLREVIEESSEVEAGDDLDLLAFVGGDLPGAVIVRPSPDQSQVGPPGEMATLTDPGEEPEDPREDSPDLRFSLAGVQLKFSMLLKEDKLTLPARDEGGQWIVKFDSARFPHLPENEYSMLEWARAAGFDVPELRLFPATHLAGFPQRYAMPGSSVLVIARYDRTSEGRIHQEDFAQAIGLPPQKKYDQVTYVVMAHLVRRFIDEDATTELVRRLVLTIAVGNNDAHLKNWSLVYPDRVHARWAPLYDQVATIAWPEPQRALSLKLAGAKDFSRIDHAAFERFAEKADLEPGRTLDLVSETLETLRRTWAEIGADLPLPRTHTAALRKHWRRVPLLRETGDLD